MNIFEALFLGLVQGLTEFIPVSSSGHLLLGHELFGTAENTLGFDIALHVGTLLALFIYFRKDIFNLIKNIFAKNKDGNLARLLIVATLPAAIAGFLLGDYVDNNLRSQLLVAVTLAIGGLVMIWADNYAEKLDKKSNEVTNKQGIIVGVAQTLALVPGVSRSGATITTGLFLGLDRKSAARFSFLLAIPIIAGSALSILVGGNSINAPVSEMFVGMLAAFVSGLFAIRFMLKSISKLGLKPFAYYRIALAIVVFVIVVR